MRIEGSGPVAVGIDAAVVADHHVTIRGPEKGQHGEVLDRFSVPSTLVGLERLGKRLAEHPGSVVVCEPTSMTWLSIGITAEMSRCVLALVGTRHAARLRGALSGKNKSDVIDSDVLDRPGSGDCSGYWVTASRAGVA